MTARKWLRQSGSSVTTGALAVVSRWSPWRFDRAAVEFAQQIGHVARVQVDHVLRERFACRQAHRFAHRAFGPVRHCVRALREAADIGGGVVDLLAQLRSIGYRAALRRGDGCSSSAGRG